jgi:hypothetical protein
VSLNLYASNFRSLLSDLKRSLSEDEIDSLTDAVSAMRKDGWDNFYSENIELIDTFQKATPSRRASLKKFQDPRLKGLLTLAAAQRLKSAWCLSEKFLEAERMIGMSYRDASIVAADLHTDLVVDYRDCMVYWPFDSHPPEGFEPDRNDYVYDTY